jgi:general secretion pathway protein G
MDDFLDLSTGLSGHGTHISGAIGATGNNARGVAGVNWKAALMPLKAFDSTGDSNTGLLLSAIEYADQKGAHIINCSFGGTVLDPALKLGIDSSPALFVCSAGNDGADTDITPNYPSSFDSPNILSVAASDQDDVLASFSNFGATSVDLAAPGENILSTMKALRLAPFSDNFNDGDITTPAWTSDGTWGLTNSVSDSFSYSLTDSPGGNYPPNANSIVNTPGFSLLTDCSLQYRMRLDTEQGLDFLNVEAATDNVNGPWTTLSTHSGTTGGVFETFVDSLTAFDGANPLHIRFRLTSDGTNEFDGAYIDDVKVLCPFIDPEYGFSSGTSMAAPHVSGVAALLKTEVPSLTNLGIKEMVLNGVDPVSSLITNSVSGGRLNAYGALTAVPSPPSNLTASATSSTEINLAWVDNSATEDGFKIERKTDAAGTFAQIDIALTNSVSFSDTGLSPSTLYFYRVRAFTGSGDSVYSNEASATTQASPPALPPFPGGGGGCFIATAAYGSRLAPEVAELRRFRDERLLTNAPGRAFVRLYYRYSPPVADIISQHGGLRLATRVALSPVVYGIKYPCAPAALAAFAFAGLLYGARRKKGERALRKRHTSGAGKGAGGFTLIELLVVMLILSLLAAVIAPRLIGRAEDARITEAKVQIRNFETALKLFRIDNGFYPETGQGLEALTETPSAGRIPRNYREGGYLEQRIIPVDPWGSPYIYVSPGLNGDFDIISLGADGEEGGEGGDADINNWEIQ